MGGAAFMSLALRLQIAGKLATLTPFAAGGALPSHPADTVVLPPRLQVNADLVKSGAIRPVGDMEVKRICDLPIHRRLTAEEVEAYSQENTLAQAYADGFRLKPEQAEAAMAYQIMDGGMHPIGVGGGKTLLGFLIQGFALAKGHRRVMTMAPAHLMAQLTGKDIRWARSKIPMPYDIHVLWGKSAPARLQLAQSGKGGLYIMPYSLLSAQDGELLFNLIRPETLYLDEAHNLAKRSAARTRRFLHYVEKYEPEMIAVSGTLTGKSVVDYWHLAKFGLGEYNPLPNGASLAEEWGQVIDTTAPDTNSNPGPILDLVRWGRKNFPQETFTEDLAGFRHAYQVRLNHTPGVVSSGANSIKTSLVYCNKPVLDYKQRPGWGTLKEFMDMVELAWLTPNGDEIEYAIHTYKWLNELSTGFYNQYIWPTAAKLAAERMIGEAEAADLLERARIRHAAKQAFNRLLRDFLQNDTHRPGLDSPLLVESNIARYGARDVGDELATSWAEWKALHFDHCPEREKSAVRVCDFKVNAAANWVVSEVPKGKGCVVWYYHQEVGPWICEALQKLGIVPLHCPAGKASDKAICDESNSHRIVVASLPAHYEGKNLQHFEHMCFVEFPRTAKMAEQSVGRLHRTGQMADEIQVVTFNTLEFDELKFAATLIDSLYVHQTTGTHMKLIYGNYDPLPKMFPPAVLRERGFQNELLNARQQRLLEEKFSAG